MTRAAASSSNGMPRLRARSLAVPSGMMPSGRPVCSSPGMPAFSVPSPPPITTRSTPAWRAPAMTDLGEDMPSGGSKAPPPARPRPAPRRRLGLHRRRCGPGVDDQHAPGCRMFVAMVPAPPPVAPCNRRARRGCNDPWRCGRRLPGLMLRSAARLAGQAAALLRWRYRRRALGFAGWSVVKVAATGSTRPCCWRCAARRAGPADRAGLAGATTREVTALGGIPVLGCSRLLALGYLVLDGQWRAVLLLALSLPGGLLLNSLLKRGSIGHGRNWWRGWRRCRPRASRAAMRCSRRSAS